jgi:hypothetical protein
MAATSPDATVVVVTPGALRGWQIQVTASPAPTPSVTFVNGPGTPPMGTGSAQLSVGPNGGSAAQLRQPNYSGVILPDPNPANPPAANELSLLSYSTYIQTPGSGGQAPYIILNVDYNGDTTVDDNLFFEPAYQEATFCPANPQPTLMINQWQAWDAANGCWWSVQGTGGATPGTGVKTLRQIRAAQPGARIMNSGALGGLRLVAGFGAGAWDNFVGNVDAVTIGTGGSTLNLGGSATTYDFELVGPTAAQVAVAGRVTDASGGRGVAKAMVSLVDADGNVRAAVTNQLGYYRFDSVPAGANYVFSVSHKRYTFDPQVVNVDEKLTELNFTANP